MTQPTTQTWLDFALQQLAAESYLDGFDIGDRTETLRRLMFGNNDPRANEFPKQGVEATEAILPGASRMTQTQATAFLDRYQVVDQIPNNPSGFSATLLYDTHTLQYTLSFRSTEFPKIAKGGDRERDIGEGFPFPISPPGADAEIGMFGFSFAQLDSMERYYASLKDGTRASSVVGTQRIALQAFADRVAVGEPINLASYSLGGHLATIFTELHASEIRNTYLFNSAGRGETTNGWNIAQLLTAYRTLLVDPAAYPMPAFLRVPFTNIPGTQSPLPLLGKALYAALRGLPLNPDSIYQDPRHQYATQVLGSMTTGAGWLSTRFGTPQGEIESVANSKIFYMYGMGGHGDDTATALAGITPTNKTRLFIEDQPDIYGLGGFFDGIGDFFGGGEGSWYRGDFLRTHSITLIIDSLALTGVYEKLGLQQQAIETIFAASSNGRGVGSPIYSNSIADSSTLENALDTLRRLLGLTGSKTAVDLTPDGFGHLTNRASFYDTLERVKSKLASANWTVQLLAGMQWVPVGPVIGRDVGSYTTELASDPVSREDLIGLAKRNDPTGLAYRYALQQGNPFAVTSGLSYQAFNTMGELDLFDPASGKGTWTDEYIQDRIDALRTRLRINVSDFAYQDASGTQSSRYVDLASGESTYILAQVSDGVVVPPSNVSARSDVVARSFDYDFSVGRGRVVAFGREDNGSEESISGGKIDDRLYGGGGSDRLVGNEGDDYLQGDAGVDSIDAGSGDDEVCGGEGDDTIDGGAGKDRLYGGLGADTINGGENDDVIYGDKKDDPESIPVSGDDTINGGSGNDKIWGGGGVDTIHGGADVDVIEGNAGDDILFGDAGVDDIRGGAGEDFIIGGDGKDIIAGGADRDIIYGGRGDVDDQVKGNTVGYGNTLLGNGGNDDLFGDRGNDLLNGGSDRDILVGNRGFDTLIGDTGDDDLYGDLKEENSDGEDDELSGGQGKDKLFGGGGRDLLEGGADDDTLRGGKGVGDYMVGGTGKDTYIFKKGDGTDVIFDEDGNGEIRFNDTVLTGGKRKDKKSLVFYDNISNPTWIYIASSDPTKGVVEKLVIRNVKDEDTLFVEKFDQTDPTKPVHLGITLEGGGDGNGGPGPEDMLPPPPDKPATPPRRPGPGTRGDPLMVDLGSSGVATFGLEQNLHFDLDGDGFAERVAWAGAEDGVLVFDRNDDGVLNDGQELFGDFTKLAGGQLATGGFQALSQYDANRDGRIDAADPVWTQLKVGVWESAPSGTLLVGDPTSSMSLKSMEELGIESISLASTFQAAPNPDPSVTVEMRRGSLTFTDGSTTGVSEFQLARDNADTTFRQWRDVPEEIAALPDLNPGGVLMPLQQALVRDAQEGYLGRAQGSLRTKLDAFLAETDVTGDFARFEDLLFSWSGADAIAAGTMLNGVLDARHAAVLEKFYGQPFQNPNYDQGAFWQTTYENLTETFYANLMAQTHFRDYYSAVNWQENEAVEGLFGNLSAPQASLDALLSADPVVGRATINEFGRTLRGLGLVANTTYLAFREHFTGAGTDPSLSFAFDSVGKKVNTPVNGGYPDWLSDYTDAVHSAASFVTHADGGNDVLYGDDNPGPGSALVGGPGDNILVSGPGGGVLFGWEGNDLLDAGAGGGLVLGGAGDDLYIFRRGGGHQSVGEIDGTDTVFFGSGITRDDLLFTRTKAGDSIRIAGTDDVLFVPVAGTVVTAGLQTLVAHNTIERWMFDDGTVLRYEQLFAPTPGNDILYGSARPDTIDALAGDDTVSGGAGDDRLIGNDGDDSLTGDAGNDVLEGGEGNDTLTGGLGDDVFDGGAGDDLLLAVSQDPDLAAYYNFVFFGIISTNGNDTYRFGFGDGHDTVLDADQTELNLDTVALKEGVTPADVALDFVGRDLVITLSSGDSLTFLEHFYNSANALERITFADGTVWGDAELHNLTRNGTDGNDVLFGVRGANMRLSGGGGNDALTGDAGDDVLSGDDGADFLFGGNGNDELRGGAGNDYLFGEAGDDTLRGGDGNDTLDGGEGADLYDGGAGDDLLVAPDSLVLRSPAVDTFLFGRGDGHDRIVSRRYEPASWWFTGSTTSLTDDVVRFKAGVTPGDIIVSGGHTTPDATNDLVLTIAGDPGSALVIQGFLGGGHYGSTIGRFEFEDGTTWTPSDIASRLVWRGTEGRDGLYSTWGDDDVAGLGGDDYINSAGGDDTIDAGAGNDEVDGYYGNDVIHGGEGKDLLFGGPGDDTIFGDEGDDTIYTGAGNDIADGGAGNDLIGIMRSFVSPDWEGDLTVLFGRGDGQDTVVAVSGQADSNDTLRLKPGISPDDITLSQTGDDLVVGISGAEDRITLSNWFLPAAGGPGQPYAYRIENIAFDGGTVLDVDAIRGRMLVGSDGADYLRGFDDRDDRLVGNGGDDLLHGGLGADVYEFGNGDGHDTILAGPAGDAIEFRAGVNPGDVLVRNAGGDLRLSLQGGDSILVEGEFRGADSPVDEVRFTDSTTWSRSELRSRALAGTTGDDVIEGFDDSNDVLSGAGGMDHLEGGGGDDLYVFETGTVTISDRSGFDTLSFGSRAPQDLSFSVSDGRLLVQATATGDSVSIADFVGDFGPSGTVDQFLFSDGAISLSAAEILVLTGTAATDVLFGTDADDLLVGSDRRTQIFAGAGNDTALGGGGSDQLFGGDGNDRLEGGTGRDRIDGGSGDDTIAIALGDGLDDVIADSGAGYDSIEFGPDIDLDDFEIATLANDGGYGGGYGGYGGGYGGYGGGYGGDAMELAIGVRGTNDGATISQFGHGNGGSNSVTSLSVRAFRLAGGMQLTVGEILARADGKIGYQQGTESSETLKGSAADDSIYAGGGDDAVLARGNDDSVYADRGADVVSAGAGEDFVDGGAGDDVIAGEKGDDSLQGGAGSDTFVFNYGDGADTITGGQAGDVDTLSFGVGVTPGMVSGSADGQGNLTLLVDSGLGGRIRLASPVQRVQFVDADGVVRVFDLVRLVSGLAAQLGTSGATGTAVPLFADASSFELTGTVVPAGGDRAVAYAQTGDLFGSPFYAGGNVASADSDVLIGSAANDVIEAGEGDDLVSGGAGSDFLSGGAGNDQLEGGGGNDSLFAGPGNDTASGGDGDDRYFFNAGDGTLTIEDDAFERGPNSVIFGPGISAESLKLAYEGDTLLIDPGTPGDQVRLRRFDALDPFGPRAVGFFQFDDGSMLSYGDLVQRGFDIGGTVSADALLGTSSVDRIAGGEGDDQIAGRAGNDVLAGDAGSDTYFFNLGDGIDVLLDRESSLDHNVLRFGSDIDPSSVSLVMRAGTLELRYGPYGDRIDMPDVDLSDASKGPAFDLMRFGSGSTLNLADLIANGLSIYGTPDVDRLNGTPGNDSFFGAGSADFLAGGPGDDAYYVSFGTGLDVIDDVSDATQTNWVVFQAGGIGSFDNLSVGFDRDAKTLTLRIAGTEDGVVLTGFDADDALGSHAVENFYFLGSGQQSSYADLIARGFLIDGTQESDLLRGTSARDLIRGFEGNDVILGGRGGDTAEGGSGDDTYVFNRGDGVLTIRDVISQTAENTVQFGPGITAADLRNNLRFTAPDPATGAPGLLRIGLGGGDEVAIEGFDPEDPEQGAHAVEFYRFDDGTTLSYRELVLNTFIVQGDFGDDLLFGTNTQDRLYGFEDDDELHAGRGNDTLTGGIGDDLLFGEDGADMYVFHAGDGHDTIFDSGDSFDGNFISFTPDVDPSSIAAVQDGNDMLITYGAGDSIRIVGWDPSHPAIREIRLNNDPVTAFTVASLDNLAPQTGASLLDQFAFEDQALVYQLPGDAFSDPESGGLSYYAGLAGGNALPAWLAFDPLTQAFYGTPANADVGSLDIVVTARDAFGASVSQGFALTVANTNDTPFAVDRLGDQTATQDELFERILPSDEFADADLGDTLSFAVTRRDGTPLPAWLQFDPVSRQLRGMPGNADVGDLEVRVTAADAAGASATDDLTVTVEDVNDSPVVFAAIPDQSATEDFPFEFVVQSTAFADPDAGDVLTTFATLADGDALPFWLSYDSATLTFSGTPSNDDVGFVDVAVTAVDSSGASVSDVFHLTIANTNDAPIAQDDLATVVAGESPVASGNVLDNDIDIDTDATLSVVDAGPRAGAYGNLTLNAGGAYVYTLDEALVRSLGAGATVTDTFSYEVSDGYVSAPASLVVSVTGANDAPTAVADFAVATEDDVTPTTGDVLANDTDPDIGDFLFIAAPDTYVGAYGTLTLGEEGTYSYVVNTAAVQSLAEGQHATDTFSYVMTDGLATSASALTITIMGLNDAPVVSNAIDGQVATQDSPFSFALPADTFFDVDDGDSLTYSTVGALPGWLSFDAATATFSGTPGNGDVGMANVTVRATDTHGEYADASFTLAVGNLNDNPVAVADTVSATEDAQLSATGNVLDNDYDIDEGTVLTVYNPGTFTGTYGSVTIASNGAYTYQLNNASTAVQRLRQGEHVTDVFAYAAYDNEAFTTSTLTVTVTGTNDAPVIVNDTGSVQEDTVTVASGNALLNDRDADAGAMLSVANAGTYVGLYGTLSLAATGIYSYTLNNASAAVQALRANQTVSDVFGYSVTDGLATTTGGLITVSVSGKNDAPTAVADTASGVTEDGVTSVSGSVLANDTDVDSGTTLTVANAGTLNGTYGTLTLNGNGAYTYSLNNASATVQSLAAGQGVNDVFSYTATDGGATSSSTLTVGIAGANDAPVVSNPIADQSVGTGQAFNFTFAANAFTDVDQGAVLTYASGTLPAWLTFNGATRTFSGTPATTDAGSFNVRVTATDNLSASTFDDFALTVGDANTGQLIIGTDGDDILTGTPFDDVIDGRGGFDKMSGAKGNDVYFVDDTGHGGDHHRLDQVVERSNEGYDTVYAAADYTLPDNVEEVHLLGEDDLGATGNALGNVLEGNCADNTLSGGAGSDTYVYSLGGGSDTVDEKGTSGQIDTLKLQGMAANTVRVSRKNNDLVVDFPGRDGKVTVKNWFANSASRVEQFKFDDGTVWDETQIRSRVGQHVAASSDGGTEDMGHGHRPEDNHGDSHSGDDGHGGHRDDDDECRHDTDEAILHRLQHPVSFSFEEITRALGQSGPTLSAAEIARRWASVRGYFCDDGSCNNDDDHHGSGTPLFPSLRDLGLTAGNSGGCGFGFEGSTGSQHGGDPAFQCFNGLSDGFKKL